MTDSTHGASKGWAVAGMVLAVLFWGTQFPLSQHVLQSIDQYYFGVLRYGIGVARMPEADTVLAQLPAIVYIGVFPFYMAIFLFAIAVARLGAVNTLLLANATPVAVFAIEAMRGHPPLPVELAGAAIVIGALVANNLIDHRARALARVAA